MRSRGGWGRLAWLGAGLALAACMGPRAAGAGGPTEPLAGTSWRLTELNGRPPVALPGGGAPTLEFAQGEARASGNGGCNQFNGPFTQDGASVHFGPLVSTRRACADPSANAQETAYLRALETATSVSVAGDELLLLADGQPVARLRRSGS
jgi:heat shock protein HslJ